MGEDRTLIEVVRPTKRQASEGAIPSGAEPRVSPSEDRRERTGAPVLLIVGRLILLFLAALALAGSLALAHGSARVNVSPNERYACPMHPEVLSPIPGDCPICKMALERVSGQEKAPATSLATQPGAVAEVERRLVTQFVRAPAWLDANGIVTTILHPDDIVGVVADEHALFFPSAAPAAGITVRLSSRAPEPWDQSTVRVTFRIDGAAGPDTGWLELGARPRELLVVPVSAVLYSGEGAYVLAAPKGAHAFTRRAIQIGKILDSGHVAELAADRLGAISVLSGLDAGERVIAGDTFFLDAERRLAAARGRAAEVSE